MEKNLPRAQTMRVASFGPVILLPLFCPVPALSLPPCSCHPVPSTCRCLVGCRGGVALLLLVLWWLVDELAVTLVTCNILSHIVRSDTVTHPYKSLILTSNKCSVSLIGKCVTLIPKRLLVQSLVMTIFYNLYLN